MTAKNIDLDGTGLPGISPKSIEAGPQDWAFTCGVCHVGGGQMEYDRDMNAYDSSANSGDYYRYERPTLANGGQGRIVAGYMSGTNKAEIDCLLCHLHDSTNISGNGRAWYQSMGCSVTNPMGPINDPACSGVSSIPGISDAGMFTPGTKYDMYNRNLALKAKEFQYAASLGIGATATGLTIGADGGPTFTGISWGAGVPVIPAADIQATPNSQNCAVCHARDDNTPGFPGMMAMKFGYGNYALINPPGTALDRERGATGTNDVLWFELGCKTGMGKRTQKTGPGLNDKWGLSMFNMLFGLGKNYGDPVVSETITPSNPMFSSMQVTTKERIPDEDVHDAAGMQCGTCHYALGSKFLSGAASNSGFIAKNQDGTITIPASEVDGIAFPSETIEGIDHQFGQFGTMEDTFSKLNLDGTTSCESCHTTRDNPRLAENGGTLIAPTPTHNAFPAFHIQKIACITCHVPEVYASPGRLKYRDYSLGYWKLGADVNGGWRNILDWNYDLITGSAKPIPPLYVWATRNGRTQIVPVLPSTIPVWEVANTNSDQAKASESGNWGSCDGTDAAYADQACATNADCGTGTCQDATLDMSDLAFFGGNPGLGASPAPANALDTTAAALAVEALANDPLRRGSTTKNEVNGANMIPLFDGFTQADSWAVDTKARLNAMYDAGAGTEIRIFQAARFDVTHGVVPKEWALGGTKRGGCISCHSSADPNSPNYSKYSVGFFEGYQQPINNAGLGIGQYDLIKNWFALFADYDCTAYCGMGNQDDGAFFDPAGNVITGAACGAGSPFQNIDQCVGHMQTTFDKAMGFPSGTSAMMGLNDGIAGLQGFTVRETVSGSTLGCNPFAGAASMSPIPGQSINNCMSDTFNAGACIGADPGNGMPGQCDNNSFRYKGACMTNSDCNGAISDATEKAKNPYGLLYSRAEIRDHFKIQLQQATSAANNTDHHNELTWPIAVEPNPDRPASAQVTTWDKAGSANVCGEFHNQPCCTNPATGAPATCADGMNVNTTIHENELLNFDPTTLATLMNPGTVGAGAPQAIFNWWNDSADYVIDFNANSSTCPGSCTYSWDFGDGSAGTGAGVSHDYSGTGGTPEVVALTVIDTTNGTHSTTSQTVTPLKAHVAPSGCSRSTVSVSGMKATFTDDTKAGTDGTPGVYVNWGDGSPLTITTINGTPTHTYIWNSGPKGYKITEIVQDDQGFICTQTWYVAVGNSVTPTTGNVTINVTSGVKTSYYFKQKDSLGSETTKLSGSFTDAQVAAGSAQFTLPEGSYDLYLYFASGHTCDWTTQGASVSTGDSVTVSCTSP